MGLFDKKSKLEAEFEALEEEIEQEASIEILDTKPVQPRVPAPPPPAPPPPPEDSQRHVVGQTPAHYGIERALELVRALPVNANEMMLEIVRTTLASAAIPIGSVIDDAERHSHEVERAIGAIEGEIDALEKEITSRQSRIVALQGELAQIARVRTIFAPMSKPAPMTTPPIAPNPLPAQAPRAAPPSAMPAASLRPPAVRGPSGRR